MHKNIRIGIVLSCLIAVYGCSTPASPIAMSVSRSEVPEKKTPVSRDGFSVRNVSGGKETNPALTSQVSDDAFKEALSQSLSKVGFAPQGASQYYIDANLKTLDQPLFGFVFDVVSTVEYTVEGNNAIKVYTVTATGTATPSDAFSASDRLRKANERSIKENIKQFLKYLSADFDK